MHFLNIVFLVCILYVTCSTFILSLKLQLGLLSTSVRIWKRSCVNRKCLSCHQASFKENRRHLRRASAFWRVVMTTESWPNMSIQIYIRHPINLVQRALFFLRVNWVPIRQNWIRRRKCAADDLWTTTCTRAISESLLKMWIPDRKADLFQNCLVNVFKFLNEMFSKEVL